MALDRRRCNWVMRRTACYDERNVFIQPRSSASNIMNSSQQSFPQLSLRQLLLVKSEKGWCKSRRTPHPPTSVRVRPKPPILSRPQVPNSHRHPHHHLHGRHNERLPSTITVPEGRRSAFSVVVPFLPARAAATAVSSASSKLASKLLQVEPAAATAAVAAVHKDESAGAVHAVDGAREGALQEEKPNRPVRAPAPYLRCGVS